MLRGAHSVATGALIASRLVGTAKLVRVNGAPGLVSFDTSGRPYAVMGFAFRAGKITEVDILGDPDRLARLESRGHPVTSRMGRDASVGNGEDARHGPAPRVPSRSWRRLFRVCSAGVRLRQVGQRL